MQHVNDVALPLLLEVEKELLHLAGIRLDARDSPPLPDRGSRDAQDPLLRTIPVASVNRDVTPVAVAAVLDRCGAAGAAEVESAELVCAVCSAAVDAAAADGSLTLGQVPHPRNGHCRPHGLHTLVPRSIWMRHACASGPAGPAAAV